MKGHPASDATKEELKAMAPNVCCNRITPQAVDNTIASANLQRKLTNPHFFPFKLNKRKSRFMETHSHELWSVLKLLSMCIGWESSLQYHVTHTSMRHSSPPQLGSQHGLLRLTKFLEFPGWQRCLYLLQPFAHSWRPLLGQLFWLHFASV